MSPPPPTTARPPTPPAQISVSLDERPLSEGNRSMASPLLPVGSQRPSFSPADCRTLQKILYDARSPLPSSPTPYCENYELARSDERQDGYEDEDDSMELSDGEAAFEANEEKNADTIEDVMNIAGKTAPPMPVRDYSSFYAHDTPTPNGAKELRLRRASIEKSLEKQCRRQERVQAIATPDGFYDVEEQRVATSAIDPAEVSGDHCRASVSSSDVRRASEGTPLASTSFINFPPPACTVVQTPNGKHIDFATSAPISDTLVDNTLDYFKVKKGVDVLPSKCQRNASSPEAIVELAREARVEEEEAAEQRELAELDQFRDMDLAPIETVMDGGPAGDLIMYGTPLKAKDEELLLPRASDGPDSRAEDWNHTKRSQCSIPSPRRHTILIEQDEENDADVHESDIACGSAKQQLAVFSRRPTFITIIGMLPAAMFWATVARVVEGGSKVFDMLIEKLTGLEV